MLVSLFSEAVKKENFMIQVGTHLVVADNSGARSVQCIKVLNKPKQNMGYAGSTLVISRSLSPEEARWFQTHTSPPS